MLVVQEIKLTCCMGVNQIRHLLTEISSLGRDDALQGGKHGVSAQSTQEFRAMLAQQSHPGLPTTTPFYTDFPLAMSSSWGWHGPDNQAARLCTSIVHILTQNVFQIYISELRRGFVFLSGIHTCFNQGTLETWSRKSLSVQHGDLRGW